MSPQKNVKVATFKSHLLTKKHLTFLFFTFEYLFIAGMRIYLPRKFIIFQKFAAQVCLSKIRPFPVP
jgi:hypothetical protein